MDDATSGSFVTDAAIPTRARARAGKKQSTVVDFVVVVTYPHGFLNALRVS